jgi:hypothetical protein
VAAERSVVAVAARYDAACPAQTAADTPAACTLLLPPLPAPASPPLRLHYSLTRFHQNHRRYARSRWDAQLRGDGTALTDPAGPALDAACAPRAREVVAGPGGATELSAPVVPCGLIAWSTFNDTFSLDALTSPSTNTSLPLDETNIGWALDSATRFGNGTVWASPGHNADPASRGGRAAGRAGAFSVPLSADEHLQVWMRPAALPSFRKPWGVVRTGPTLPAGTVLALTVRSGFNVGPFGGAKGVVLTTTSWLGGANAFTGWALVGAGGAHAVAAAGLTGVGWSRARRAGAGAAWVV